jgi:hypothetical protein
MATAAPAPPPPSSSTTTKHQLYVIRFPSIFAKYVSHADLRNEFIMMNAEAILAARESTPAGTWNSVFFSAVAELMSWVDTWAAEKIAKSNVGFAKFEGFLVDPSSLTPAPPAEYLVAYKSFCSTYNHTDKSIKGVLVKREAAPAADSDAEDSDDIRPPSMDGSGAKKKHHAKKKARSTPAAAAAAASDDEDAGNLDDTGYETTTQHRRRILEDKLTRLRSVIVPKCKAESIPCPINASNLTGEPLKWYKQVPPDHPMASQRIRPLKDNRLPVCMHHDPKETTGHCPRVARGEMRLNQVALKHGTVLSFFCRQCSRRAGSEYDHNLEAKLENGCIFCFCTKIDDKPVHLNYYEQDVELLVSTNRPFLPIIGVCDRCNAMEEVATQLRAQKRVFSPDISARHNQIRGATLKPVEVQAKKKQKQLLSVRAGGIDGDDNSGDKKRKISTADDSSDTDDSDGDNRPAARTVTKLTIPAAAPAAPPQSEDDDPPPPDDSGTEQRTESIPAAPSAAVVKPLAPSPSIAPPAAAAAAPDTNKTKAKTKDKRGRTRLTEEEKEQRRLARLEKQRQSRASKRQKKAEEEREKEEELKSQVDDELKSLAKDKDATPTYEPAEDAGGNEDADSSDELAKVLETEMLKAQEEEEKKDKVVIRELRFLVGQDADAYKPSGLRVTLQTRGATQNSLADAEMVDISKATPSCEPFLSAVERALKDCASAPQGQPLQNVKTNFRVLAISKVPNGEDEESFCISTLIKGKSGKETARDFALAKAPANCVSEIDAFIGKVRNACVQACV